MATSNITVRKRGRPKGTGLDDSETLRRISALLAADKYLKPTTAIRRAGVTNASVIRRLREKLKVLPKSAAATRRQLSKLSPEQTARPKKSSTRQVNPPTQVLPAKANPQSPTQRQESFEPSAIAPTQATTSQTDGSRPAPNPDPTLTSAQKTAQQAPPRTTPSDATAVPLVQLEAMRLAADAATAMSRLYLHCMTNATTLNPISIAMQNQQFMTRWMSGLWSAPLGNPIKQSQKEPGK